MTDNVFDFPKKSNEIKELETTEEICITFIDGEEVRYNVLQYGVSRDLPDFLIVYPREPRDYTIMYNATIIKSIESLIS